MGILVHFVSMLAMRTSRMQLYEINGSIHMIHWLKNSCVFFLTKLEKRLVDYVVRLAFVLNSVAQAILTQHS